MVTSVGTMLVLDTNVLVRLIIEDNIEQTAIAKQAIEGQQVWISATVLLELAWVLRSNYKFKRQTVVDVLELLLDTQNFHIEDESAVRQSCHWFKQQGDFADALHLARTQYRGAFLTFDKDFCIAAEANILRL